MTSGLRFSVEYILSMLTDGEVSALPPGIYGGKTGYALLVMSAAQKYGASAIGASCFDRAGHIIADALSDLCPPDRGFLNGNSGIVWALKKLHEMGVIESSEKFDRFADIIIQHGIENFYTLSNDICPENGIYPWGITLLPFWDGSESLNRYRCEEKILLCLMECERILDGDGPYAFPSAVSSPALLHSVFHFASRARAMGIGPVRACRLTARIAALCRSIGGKRNDADAAILNALVGNHHPVCLPPQGATTAYLGTIAMIYGRPELFLPTHMAGYTRSGLLTQMSPQELIGTGLGLICCNEN